MARRVAYGVWIWLAAMLLAAGGCTKPRATLKLALSEDTNSSYRFMTFARSSKQAMFVEATVIVTQGKGEQVLPVSRTSVVWVFTASDGAPSIALYVEKGNTLTISGGSDPYGWEVKGNAIDEAWSAWRKANQEALKSRDAKKVNAAVAAYVEKHREEPLSALLLLCHYYRKDDPTQFAKLWNSLGEEARSPEVVATVEDADAFGGLLPEMPDTVQELSIYVKGDSMLPYRATDYKATLFYVRDGSDQTADQNALKRLDSLRKARKGLFLADVSLEQDSTTWSYNLRRDSTGVVHSWTPAGIQSPHLAALKPPSTPYYIVLDSTGVQQYRGRALEQALQKIEKISRPKAGTK